jgi:hypothetical protein
MLTRRDHMVHNLSVRRAAHDARARRHAIRRDVERTANVKGLSTAVIGLVVVGLAGCGAEKARKAAQATPPKPTVETSTNESEGRVERREVTTVTATVVGVDQDKREVTLRGHDGNVLTIHVGDVVGNLAQVRKGDRVVVKYYESLAFKLNKKGEKGAGTVAASAADRAALGEKPAAAVGDTVTVTTTVTKVDRKNDTVVLKGPKGKSAVVRVREPRHLDDVKKGDTVDVTYTEALAIAVEPAP